MRVLHCQGHGWPVGGAETYVFNLVRALADSGQRAAILTHSNPRNTPLPGIPWYAISPAKGARGAMQQWKQIEAILKREKPDLIHLHESLRFLKPHVLRQLQLRLPVVLTIHFSGVFCPKRTQDFKGGDVCPGPSGFHCLGCVVKLGDLRAMLVNHLRSYLLRRASIITVGSQWLRNLAVEYGAPPGRTLLLPPYWHNPPQESAAPEKSKVILFVGRIIQDKGIFHLIGALAPLESHSWRLLVIGEGPEEKRLRESIVTARLENRVSFEGVVPHENMGKFFKNGAFLVMPSLFPETFGIAGAEAMSAGLPVVAYDGGGVSEWLVHGRNGLMVSRGDIQGLGQAIRKLLENPSLRQEMGRAAREDMAMKYSRRSHLERLYHIYERALLMHSQVRRAQLPCGRRA